MSWAVLYFLLDLVYVSTALKKGGELKYSAIIEDPGSPNGSQNKFYILSGRVVPQEIDCDSQNFATSLERKLCASSKKSPVRNFPSNRDLELDDTLEARQINEVTTPPPPPQAPTPKTIIHILPAPDVNGLISQVIHKFPPNRQQQTPASINDVPLNNPMAKNPDINRIPLAYQQGINQMNNDMMPAYQQNNMQMPSGPYRINEHRIFREPPYDPRQSESYINVPNEEPARNIEMHVPKQSRRFGFDYEYEFSRKKFKKDRRSNGIQKRFKLISDRSAKSSESTSKSKEHKKKHSSRSKESSSKSKEKSSSSETDYDVKLKMKKHKRNKKSKESKSESSSTSEERVKLKLQKSKKHKSDKSSSDSSSETDDKSLEKKRKKTKKDSTESSSSSNEDRRKKMAHKRKLRKKLHVRKSDSRMHNRKTYNRFLVPVEPCQRAYLRAPPPVRKMPRCMWNLPRY